MERIDQYIETLEKYDHPERWEDPESFDYVKEQSDFFAAKDRIQYVLRKKLECETGSNIQDASYHSQIFLGEGTLKLEGEYALVRFSNFGKLIAFVNEDSIIESVKIDIIQNLNELGYTHIPEHVLYQPYTGKNKGVTGIDSWWVRYFDFV